jgi:hypothetical protein
MSCLRDVPENKESHMKLLRNVVCVATIVGAASFALAADTPFTGTWKLNLSKSRLVGGTVTFTPDAAGMRFTGGGDSYLLASDGSASKTSFGTAAWKKIDDHTWQETDMVKGRLDSTNTWALSADGKTLTERVTGDKPAGGTFDDTSVYVRTAGSNGLAGSWKNKEYKGSTPGLMVISEAGDGLTVHEPDFQVKAVGSFDGKPGTVEGPSIPPGSSFVLKRINSHSFKMTRTQNGKPFDYSTWAVSPDGKVIKTVWRTVGTNDPPTIEVFERQ